MIAGYHEKFLEALNASAEDFHFPDEVGEEDREHIPLPPLTPAPAVEVVHLDMTTTPNTRVSITLNGESVLAAAL